MLLLTACLNATSTQNLHAAIDAKLGADAERYGIPAQSVLVMRSGDVLYRDQRGVADIETGRLAAADDIYSAYSVSKLFASILILQLVDEDRLELEQPARLYAPALPAAWSEVTVAQLLSHTSGLPDFFDGADSQRALPATKEDVFRTLRDAPLLFAPGAETRYGQTNYVALLAILENLHGASYRDIVRDRILRPLRLNDTYLGAAHVPHDRLVSAYRGDNGELVPDPTPPWQDYSIAHAELYTTANDLGAFLTAIARGELVRPETLVRAWRPYRLRGGQDGVFAVGWDYGEREGYREVGLDGGVKVRVRLVFRDDDLNDHYVIVYLTNGSRENVWTRTLLDPIQDIAVGAQQTR